MSNYFYTLKTDSDSDQDTAEFRPVKSGYIVPSNSPVNPSTSVAALKWGDIVDTDDEDDDAGESMFFPNPNKIAPTPAEAKAVTVPEPLADNEVQTSPAEKLAWNEFDKGLGRLRSINIEYTVRSLDKETGETKKTVNVRTLKVVSKAMYDSYRTLINKYTTHSGTRVDYREQASKIKVANSLMEMAYKDPKIPYCFIYAVANIHMRDNRLLTRNIVTPGSKCYFDVSHLSYYPPYGTA